MRYAMIMAGGAGTRLWPMSRASQPKQLLPLIRSGTPGDDPVSLLQVAADRLDSLVEPDHRYICTGEAYRPAIRHRLPAFADAQILGEPQARDTLNAVGLTAAVLAKLDKDAIFAVFTADHVIQPVDKFRKLVDLGFRLVEAEPRRLVTFSIKPTYPATGFGYVERGSAIAGVKGGDNLAFRVARFVEKPNIQRAQAYVESGQFGWNSGMFVWKASTVLDCIQRFKPEAYDGLLKIQKAWGTKEQQKVLAEVYPTLPKISVDFAIMEPAGQAQQTDSKFVQVATVMMDLSWLDVGSWPSYAETLPADNHNNRVGGSLSADTALILQSANCLAVSSDPKHTVAILGCENLIVVHTPDATLVMPREKAEELKALHAQVRDGLK